MAISLEGRLEALDTELTQQTMVRSIIARPAIICLLYMLVVDEKIVSDATVAAGIFNVSRWSIIKRALVLPGPVVRHNLE